MQDQRNDVAAPVENSWDAPPGVPVGDYREFAVLDTGRIVADGPTAVSAAEALLYMCRVAEPIGFHLGSGALEAVEIFGRGAAYATVTTDTAGTLTLNGAVAPTGSSTEDLRAWLEARRLP